MKEINLKLETKTVNCEVSSIKTNIIIEEPDIENLEKRGQQHYYI